jgi:hypothetical protein
LRLPEKPTPKQSMPFAFVEYDTLVAVGFHVAVFLAMVVILLAVQWLFDRRGRR